MKTPRKPARKRNPSDSTIRNVKASRKRDDALKKRVEMLEAFAECVNDSLAVLLGYQHYPDYFKGTVLRMIRKIGSEHNKKELKK